MSSYSDKELLTATAETENSDSHYSMASDGQHSQAHTQTQSSTQTFQDQPQDRAEGQDHIQDPKQFQGQDHQAEKLLHRKEPSNSEETEPETSQCLTKDAAIKDARCDVRTQEVTEDSAQSHDPHVTEPHDVTAAGNDADDVFTRVDMKKQKPWWLRKKEREAEADEKRRRMGKDCCNCVTNCLYGGFCCCLVWLDRILK